MGLWMIWRRRWRLMLWLTLMMVVMLNALVFLAMPGSHTSKNGASRLGKDASHLQAVRKRLNKSSSNSSSLNYVDWDPKDGAFDPDIAREEIKKHIISAIYPENNNDNNNNNNNNNKEEEEEEEEENDVYPNTNLRNPEQGIKGKPEGGAVGQNEVRVQGRRLDPSSLVGARANYSLQEVDKFVKKFQAKYESSLYEVPDKPRYAEILKKLMSKRKRGIRLPSYINNRGKRTWEQFHHGIRQHYLYDPDEPYISNLMKDMATRRIVDVEQKEGGTQIKLMITFSDEGQALFKPMRFPREQETLPDHYYFADYERHNAEIAAFHLDGVLGFHRVPPTTGRWLNVSKDIHELADSKLAKTFFISPAGNWCFHGSCSYYCDSSHPICGHPIMLEGSLASFLPPMQMAKRKTWRNPWKRSYSKHRKAYWEVYNDLCHKVTAKHPYNEGRRMMDILDMAVFDFLTGNLDRHHYETFRDFGNDTFLLHLDNGRAFGKSKYDCISCLAPVRQCCMIRLSTLVKLVKLYIGPESLSVAMRESMSADPLDPILWEPHLDALDRRVSKILHVISGCLDEGRLWDEVIVDDGVT